MKDFLVIMLAGQAFAVPAVEIEEIAQVCEITPVPCHLSYVFGIFNLRGRVVTSLSLRQRLDLQPQKNELHLIMRRAQGYYGLCVDAVKDVRAFSPEDIHALPSALVEKWQAFASGLYQENGDAIMILDTNAIFDIFSARKETA